MLDYAARDIKPRVGKIVFTFDFVGTLAIAVLIAVFGPLTPLASLHAGEFVGAYMAYGAIAMGFCLGGMTIALTIPNERFVSMLSSAHPGDWEGPSAYSNLIFVFSWTAIWHWLAVVMSLVAAIAIGWSNPILPAGGSITHRIVVALCSFAVIYGLAQFLIALITLSQVGRTYVEQQAKEKAGDRS